MTTATLTNPSVTLTKSTNQEVIIFPNGSVLYGEDVVRQVNDTLGGIRTSVTQQELDFLKNGPLESIMTHAQKLYILATSQ